MDDIGSKLRSIRKEKGLSSYQLEYISGISQSNISRIESNEISPTIDTLLKLCNGLEISIIEIFEQNDLTALLKTAKQLSPEQIEKVNEMLKSFIN
ncbi:helix-turn-helix domain-containing protein [Ferdinandcohnia sp. SAFN-114]|uniref:helix-turn-helix domain-containing protein n=1 Tax=Ferdinandcohnia sp. SAFN-114 TaxID=3387275 RepID=UPI003F8128CC